MLVNRSPDRLTGLKYTEYAEKGETRWLALMVGCVCCEGELLEIEGGRSVLKTLKQKTEKHLPDYLRGELSDPARGTQ